MNVFGKSMKNITVYDIPGSLGLNYTGVSVGGFEVTDSSYLVSYNSIDFDDENNSTIRNVHLGVVNKNTDIVTDKTITDYHSDGDVMACNPILVKISDDKYVVMWEKYKLSGDTSGGYENKRKTEIDYVYIDGNGDTCSKIKSLNNSYFGAYLSDCKPIVKNKTIMWYVTGDIQSNAYRNKSKPIFYSLNTETDKLEVTPYYDNPYACGESKFKFEEGTVTISGIGEVNQPSYGWNKEKIKKVVVMNGVTSIGEEAFSGCSNLTNIEIPNSVTSIGEKAFSGCSNLASIKIPDTVTNIGKEAFLECSSLVDITLPNNVSSLKWGTFKDCSSLSSLTIPDCVMNIEGEVFSGCGNLKNITIPVGMTSIGEKAFSGCKSLTDITLPNSVNDIGNAVFFSCSNLKSIVLPNGLTSIKRLMFKNCSSLESVTFSDSVTMIETQAFFGCGNLKNIKLDENMEYIGEEAFEECYNLLNVTIPKDVKRIGSNAFSNTNLSQVYILGNMTNINVTSFDISKPIEIHGYANAEKFVMDIDNSNVKYLCLCDEGVHHIISRPAIAPTCSIDGLTEGRYCDECSLVVDKQNIISAIGHEYGEWIIVKEASCTQTGIRQKECSRCGDVVIENTEAIGHNYGEWVTVKEATCARTGIMERRCSNCGNTLFGSIEATGQHNYGEWVIVKEATKINPGRKERICLVCGNVESAVTEVLAKAVTIATPQATTAYSTMIPQGESTSTRTSERQKTQKIYDLSKCKLIAKKIGPIKYSENSNKIYQSFILCRDNIKNILTYNKDFYISKKEGRFGSKKMYVSDLTFKAKRHNASNIIYFGSKKCKAFNVKNTNNPEYIHKKPQRFSGKRSNGSVYLKWGKEPYALGYYIYRREGKGKFKKIATISDVSQNSYIDGVAGKCSYYIKTYTTNGKSLITSEKSIVKTVKN